MSQKVWAPCQVRNAPETFFLDLDHPDIPFGEIVVEGKLFRLASNSYVKASY
jgi:hypothetical protein